METKKLNSKIRLGTIINLICIVGIATIFEYASNTNWIIAFGIIETILSVSLIVSFYLSIVKTGLWSFTHRNKSQLDERELGVTYSSLQTGYAIFSIIVLSVLVISSVFEYSISIVTAALLIFFAHIVPATIIAWREKSI